MKTLTEMDLRTQASRQKVLMRAAERDPREYPWGYYGQDDAAGAGAGTFTWFPTREELLEALVEAEPALYLELDDPEFERARTGLAAVREKALLAVGLSELLRKEANEALKGEAQIGWWGTWNDLRSGGGEFEAELRTWFRELSAADDDEEERDLAAPISEEELDDFLAFVAEYGA